MIELQSNKSIKILKSDNGSEYTNTLFKDYIKKTGIIQQFSAPYTPQQNGLAERINYTLLTKVRAILYESFIPKTLWTEILLAVTYIYNRTPHSFLGFKTPYEARYNTKPDISNIRLLGSTAYYKEARTTKLQEKGNLSILIGFNKNQYKVYIPSTKRTIWTRDCTILEGKYYYKDLGKDTTQDDYNIPTQLDPITTTDIPAPVMLENQDTSTTTTTTTTTTNSSNDTDDLSEDKLGYYAFSSNTSNIADPITYRDTQQSPNKIFWDKAMEQEILSLKDNNTWTLSELPPNRKAIKGRWVYKTKLKPDGTIDKYKARWVAKGFLQKYGIDYTETFSNTVKPMAYRILFTLSAYYSWDIQQWDVKTAFINAPIEDNTEIYIIQPTGYEDIDNPTKVCRLNKALYGLKQSARQWYNYLSLILKELGFTPLISDQSIFINYTTQIIVTSHIDDLLVFSSNSKAIQELKDNLSIKVTITDLGPISYYLGIEISRDYSSKTITLQQSKYLKDILQRFKKENLKSVRIPAILGSKLDTYKDTATSNDINYYQQQIGSLIYLMTTTRPDISYALGDCSRYMANPGPEHFKALDYIWRYLLGTQDYKLIYKGNTTPILIGYSDSDWGGDYPTRRSTTGYLFTFNDTVISWSSKLQKTIALSSCEAEYMALKETIKEYTWLKTLLDQITKITTQDTTKDLYTKSLLYTDSQAAIELAKNPEHHARTKHIDIQYHYVRENILSGYINLKYIPTTQQLADGLTKPLDYTKFKAYTTSIGLTT